MLSSTALHPILLYKFLTTLQFFFFIVTFESIVNVVERNAYPILTEKNNIKKTQKRANALENITIPMYEAIVKNITTALEEKDREEHSRLKVIKTKKEK